MAQIETEKLTQILWGAALSRAVCTIAELGIADQIEAGSPQSVESIAGATGTHERSLYRILRFLDSSRYRRQWIVDRRRIATLDEQSIQILNNCRKVIPENGRLLIIEAVVPIGNDPSLAKDFDMAMLVFPGGIERTEEEYRFLFERAGFQLSSITPTASVISVVEGKPI